MTVQHFTLAKFRPGTGPKEKEKAYRTAYLLLAAALSIPGIKGFKVGPPLHQKGTRGYEFAVTVEFQDLQSFIEYIPHAHHRLLSDFINDLADGFVLPSPALIHLFISVVPGTPLSYQIDTTRVCKL
ncbi:hypothetical protein B0H10DRAFT_1267942 [Mycena sp. CBHHK59/15]|nr:hypothetical protein B0H10DRAFT_1267942 [Mycena sp. CBHHK59/15]